MYNELTIMKQKWHNLLFLHWNIPASTLTSLIPKQLKLDTYNDKAWIGIIISNAKLRFILLLRYQFYQIFQKSTTYIR